MRRTDIVARYGGEEFVVVLPDSNAEQAVAKMNAIRDAIGSEPLMLTWKDGRTLSAKLTVSIGVASWSDERGQTASELVAEADARLYETKKIGRNVVVGPEPFRNKSVVGS